jgi:methylmalonyl-CoA mutase cobalamin-binding subunit
VLDALRAKLDDATLDELAAALASDDAARAVRIEPMRDAAPFEALRRRASALASDRRRADVLAVGDARTIEPRIAFVVDVLAVAGLEARIRRATTPSELLAAAQDELGRVVVPCATDEEYLDVARALVPRLRERGARFVVLATRPNDALRASGADAFVHRGADLVSALDAALTALEAE